MPKQTEFASVTDLEKIAKSAAYLVAAMSDRKCHVDLKALHPEVRDGLICLRDDFRRTEFLEPYKDSGKLRVL